MPDYPSERNVLQGEVVPAPGGRQLRVPPETPWGLAFLGVAKFAAIRRVIDEKTAAIYAVIRHIEGEILLDDTLRRHAHARDKLVNVRREIDELRELEEIKHDIAKLELQEKKALLEARIGNVRNPLPPKPAPAKPTEYETFLNSLKNIPGIYEATRKVKDDILRQSGDGPPSPETEDLLNSLDAMLQEFVARQGEKSR